VGLILFLVLVAGFVAAVLTDDKPPVSLAIISSLLIITASASLVAGVALCEGTQGCLEQWGAVPLEVTQVLIVGLGITLLWLVFAKIRRTKLK
jgi:hypothetical protein